MNLVSFKYYKHVLVLLSQCINYIIESLIFHGHTFHVNSTENN